jgi:hypothetical protein
MTQDSLARELSAGGEPSDDPIYDALVAALRSNARGRAFLEEYARRCRAADTRAALDALARIEAMLAREHGVVPAAAPAADVDESDPDDAYVPFEIDFPPDAGRAGDTPAALEQPPRRSTADLLMQVMALSPEERIALFS